MLKPEYLEALPEAVILFMDELEEWVIADIVKQLMEAGAGESTIAKVRALLAVYDETELRKHIETAAKKAEVTAGELLQQAITKDFNAQRRAYAAAGKQAKLDPLRDLLKSAGDKLRGEILNLTGTTMGFSVKQNGKTVFQPLGEYYTNVLNRAQMEVSLGISDHQTAVRRAVKEMANSGLRQVDYESGRSVRLESAVRTAVLTGVNQASTAMTDALMTELGAEYVEVTAHSGARPEHAEWQGKVYHISELAAKTGYGTVGGLKGANCRHDYYPFFSGISERAYTDEELKHIDPPPFTFEGKEYTAYEATQMQRRYERNIRSVRDQLAGYDAAEDKESFAAYSVRLKRLEQGYREFSNAAGLRTRSDRLQMVGFGRSTSAKAVWAKRKQQNKWVESIEKSAKSSKIELKKRNNPYLETLVNELERLGVEYNEVKMHRTPLRTNEIIGVLGGGDLTSGSCASVGLAYIGQTGGMNVLDFRGGKSQIFFSNPYNLEQITMFPNVKAIRASARSEITAGSKLLKKVEIGKEYYLCVGQHASIVRKTESGTLQYLELQSARKNGWMNFHENPRSTLHFRFGCRQLSYDASGFMIEVDSLANSEDLQMLLGYINTVGKEQKKGNYGTIK